MAFFNFYDTETTGLEWGYDNILQFSAIRTDEDFNVVSSVNLRGRPFPWVIPHPAAMLTTGIGPKQIFAQSMSQYDLVKEIAAHFKANTPAINIGFNSIGYDELMLRAAFFQTLHPMYITQRGDNSRADVMLLAQAVAEHDTQALKVNLNGKGKPCFRLTDLAEANGLSCANAHDAMGDTTMTIALANFLREKSPRIYGAMMNCRNKENAAQTLFEEPYLLHTDRAFKVPTIFCTAVMQIGSDAILADLTIDPSTYLGADVATLLKLMTKQPRAFRVVKLNSFPTLIPTTPDAAGMIEPVMAAWVQLLKSQTFRENLAVALTKRYPDKEPDAYVERRMYNGFPTPDDERRMADFHGSEGLAYEVFDSLDLNEIARRLRDDDYAASLRKRLASTEKQPWLTISAAKAELVECRERFKASPPALFDEIADYLNALEAEIS